MAPHPWTWRENISQLMLAKSIEEIIWTFFVKKSFFSNDLLRFWSLGYYGVRGLGWHGHTCFKNPPRVCVGVCTKFGGDRSSGSCVKEGHRYSLF